MPADDVGELNANIVGLIELAAEYHRCRRAVAPAHPAGSICAPPQRLPVSMPQSM